MVIVGITLLVLAVALGWWTFKHKVDIRHGNNWWSVRWLPLVLAALLAAGAFFAFNVSDGKKNPANADGNSSTSTTPPGGSKVQISQEVIDALTVTSASVGCSDVVVQNGGTTVVSNGPTLVKYDIGALKGVPLPRLWSDAISTPFKNTDPQKVLGEVQANICWDPLYGSHVANAFANMKVGNVSVLSLNPWLQPFAGDPAKINDTAASYIPLLDVKNPTDAQKQAAVTQNLAWQDVAAKLDTLTTRFALGGFKAEQSTLNYHLAGDGISAKGLPGIELNSKQENLNALQLVLTEKGACAPVKVIGFNVGDKRFEEFAPPTCETPVQPSKPGQPGSTQPGCQSNCSSTTTPPQGCQNCQTATTTPPQGCQNCQTATTTTPLGRKGTPATTAPSDTVAPNPTSGTQPTVTTVPATSPSTVAPPVTQPAPTSAPPTTRVSY